jgi:transposase
MIKLSFSKEIIDQLNYERYHHPHPRVQRKMNVLYLKSQGIPHKDIKRIERISANTLLAYLRTYQENGVDGLKAVRFHKPQSVLEPHADSIEEYFRKHPPSTVNEASAKIEELTNIKRSRERTRVFLKKLGLSPRKVGMIPAKADPDIQKAYIDQKLEPRIADARAGNRTLFLSMRHTSF